MPIILYISRSCLLANLPPLAFELDMTDLFYMRNTFENTDTESHKSADGLSKDQADLSSDSNPSIADCDNMNRFFISN